MALSCTHLHQGSASQGVSNWRPEASLVETLPLILNDARGESRTRAFGFWSQLCQWFAVHPWLHCPSLELSFVTYIRFSKLWLGGHIWPTTCLHTSFYYNTTIFTHLHIVYNSLPSISERTVPWMLNWRMSEKLLISDLDLPKTTFCFRLQRNFSKMQIWLCHFFTSNLSTVGLGIHCKQAHGILLGDKNVLLELVYGGDCTTQ